MITGVIKNKIDKIWTDIWAGGLTMPFKVIEQITYLMFIRSLDQKEIKNEKKAAAFKMRGIKGKVEMIFPESESGQDGETDLPLVPGRVYLPLHCQGADFQRAGNSGKKETLVSGDGREHPDK